MVLSGNHLRCGAAICQCPSGLRQERPYQLLNATLPAYSELSDFSMIRTVLLTNPPQVQLLEGFPGSLIPLAGFVASHAPDVSVHLLDLGQCSMDAVDL